MWCEDIVGFVGVSVGGEGWEWGLGVEVEVQMVWWVCVRAWCG